MNRLSFRRVVAWLLMLSMSLGQVAEVAALTLAVAPLAATTTSVVRPNLMYVLDDSGSMAWDYTPDYINDATTAADPGSSGGSAGDGAIATISGGAVTVIGPDGSPPSFSHKYNSQPTVVIEGGGGTGASATANWNSSTKLITSISVNAGGSGYTSAPHVSLVGPVPNATWGMCWGTTAASNQGGTPKDSNASPTCTTPTQVPYATAAINYQYYDPAVRYEAPLRANGTRYANSTPTAALNDGFSASTTSKNLTSGVTHEVWCNTSTATPTAADPTAGGRCRENSSSAADPATSATASLQYTTQFYPNSSFNFRKTYNGPAFAYVMSPVEFCTDSSLTNCIRSTTAQVVSGTVFNVPAYFRWCAYYNPQTHTYGGCQGRRDLTHYIPNYLGGWVSTGAAGVQATASLVLGATTAGQSLTGLSIGGVNIVGGTTFTSAANGDQATVAQAICTAIQANTDSTGYSCAQSGATITLQASIVGTTANGLEVIAAGPADVAAANSTGSITVVSTTAGYQISSILINRSDATSVQLLAATVTSDGNVGNTAQAICAAINAGAATADYEAKSGDPADANLKYPSDPTRATAACQSNAAGYVGIRRISADTRDNGATIAVSGPATGTQYTGTITVNSTSGETRINDITLGGTSILSAANKPLVYPSGSISDGTQTALIASDIASRITASGLATGCTATASSNVVTLRNAATPATGLCAANNAIVVSATATSATGSFRVSSTGSSNAANLGGIQTSATTVNLMGSLTVANGTAVATNATALQTALNAYGSGFTAAAPVASGSNYDITVTAPAGNSHNGKTFIFQNGTAGPGGSGAQPQWTFPITGATADNAHITSITCGGTTAVPDRNTGNTSSTANYIQNLAINAGSPTYGLNGQTGAGGASGYSYSCTNASMASPQYRCTVSGPAGAAACTNLSITKDASITLSTTTPAAVGGSGGSKSWQFTFSNATTDTENISSIRCGSSDSDPQMLASTVSIGTASDPGYASTLASNINTQSSSQNGWNGTSACSASGTTVSCGFQRNAGAGNRCASVTVSKSAGATLSPGGVTETWDGTRYTYSFDITGVTAANESITQVTCNSGTGQEAMGSTATRASGDGTTDFANRINSAGTGINDWSGTENCTRIATGHIRCAFERSAGAAKQCTGGVTRNGSGVTFGSVTETWDGTRYKYTFDITNADDTGDSVSSVACITLTTTQDSMPAAASTGTASSKVVQRLNEIKAGLHNQSKTSTGTFTWSCPTAATNASPTLTCTATSTDASCTSSTLRITGSDNTGVYISGNASQIDDFARNYNVSYSATGSSAPTWVFDIQNATADNAAISAISCGGTSILPSNAPNTGTVPASTTYQRINNLTGAVASPAAAGSIGPTNGYTLSCQPATASSPTPTCTLTGPVGAAACNTDAGSGFVITKDSSISIGAVTRTNAGSAASGSTDDMMSPTAALSNLSAFAGGYAAQSATVVSLVGVATGTVNTSVTAMSNGSGVSVLTIPSNATGSPPNVLTMAGGAVADSASNHWKDVGLFTRVDIVPSNNSYTRASDRSDCLGATCTYTEELQNYANWYTYYRTRMQMMKSATTIAFSALDDKYRVGFDNICQSTGTSVKRGLAQFADSGETANQRTLWWAQLTGTTPSCATPLRSETAKIGRYYAGKLSGSTDPLQYSCQQNFMMLVTDGYWNENEPSGTGILGADIGNVDNNSTTAPRPFYDGQQAATACPATGSGRGSTASSCRTLADIAWYYYSTDLRSSAHEVTVTTTAPHGLTAGQSYAVSGVTPAAYNGTYVVFVTDATHFGYSMASDPGAYVSGGSVNGVAITAASYGSGRYSNATNPAGTDVSTNNVLISSDDANQAQHMNFYAMGLGIDGQLEYRADYQTAGTGDYYEIKNGTRNWPSVANLDQTGVDDLWHATVNGHGKYFSARNVPNVVAGLREALNKIGARVGSAAAAATSNLEPVAGDNFAYVASYATQDWVGDLQSRSIDVLTGDVSPDTGTKCSTAGTGCQWSAQSKLDNMTWSTRRVYVAPTSLTSLDPLRAFTWANLSVAEQAYFSPSSLSQYAALSVSNAADITAENLVNFLRGERRIEQDGDTSHPQIWRRRAHVMGDIVNTQPIFMKAPSGSYSDAGYSSFKASGTAATRRPVVFVSGQDGMLHAINADTAAVTVNGVAVNPGEEMWAYIPTQVMAGMKVLADSNYGSTDPANSNHHRYFIDGPITVADVNMGDNDADWHTILIGGQGAGGTSYFALDVTDPLNPTYLWQFSDSRLGYTFANPAVSKLPNGEWAVFFTSGYNNSDGLGYLFALNPKTGAIKSGYPLSTASGTAGSPSNLGKVALWATDPALNNTAEYAYAGDLNGDLWRFDLDPSASGHTTLPVFKLAHLSAGGVAQPITVKPEISTLTNGTRIVFVGTGKYLELSDLTNTDVQSLYAVKDTLGAANLGGGTQTTWNPQTDLVPSTTTPMFIQRKLISTKDDGSAITQVVNGATRNGRMVCTGASATVSAATGACANESGIVTMDWNTYGGWYTNLSETGERMNVDMKLVRGTLVFAGNVPSANSCTVGGSAWVASLDYATGLTVSGAGPIAGIQIADSLVVGLTVVKLASGDYKAIATKSNYQQETLAVPISSTSTTGSGGTGNGAFGGKRGLWREFEAY